MQEEPRLTAAGLCEALPQSEENRLEGRSGVRALGARAEPQVQQREPTRLPSVSQLLTESGKTRCPLLTCRHWAHMTTAIRVGKNSHVHKKISLKYGRGKRERERLRLVQT